MTFQEIDTLTLEGTWRLLLERLLDFSQVPAEEKRYWLLDDESLTLYQRIKVHKSLKKPLKQTLLSELNSYKEELKAIEQARLDEIARVKDIQDRWQAMEDIRGALMQAGLKIRNPALELKRIINEDDQERLKLLEDSYLLLKSKQDASKSRQDKKKIGAKARHACMAVLDLIAGLNNEKSLTDDQVDEMISRWSNILIHLQNNRPKVAKVLIGNITADDILVTQNDIDTVLAEFTENGF